MTTSGYIAIRWYQHSRHGSKCATSEKYRLPIVARSATRKAIDSAFGRTNAPIASYQPRGGRRPDREQADDHQRDDGAGRQEREDRVEQFDGLGGHRAR